VKVSVRWKNPFAPINDPASGWVWLANATLDTANGELLSPDFDAYSTAARHRPRERRT